MTTIWRPLLRLIRGVLAVAVVLTACSRSSTPSASPQPQLTNSRALTSYEPLPAARTPALRAQDPLPPLPPGTLAVGNGVTAPIAITHVRPVLPEKLRVAGPLILRAIVAQDGTVSSVAIVKDGTEPAIGPSYAKAMSQWRFKPATRNGKPVQVYLLYSIIIDVR